MGELLKLVEKPEPNQMGADFWLRRQAIQIAAQLPENEPDALRVLEFARQLVGFMMARPVAGSPGD